MFKQAVKAMVSLLLLSLERKEQNKILLVADYGKSGGTRTYFIYLLQFLRSQGHNNVTVLINEGREDAQIDQLLKQYNYNQLSIKFDFWCTNFEQIPEGLTKAHLVRYQLGEINFWCELQRKHRFSSFIFSIGYPEQYLYTLLLPVHIIYILHSTPVRSVDNYKRWLLKLSLSTQKQIITVSLFARQSIEHYWLQNKQSRYVKFVYNYYESKYRTGLTSPKQVKKVLTIGTLEVYKNPLLFIETAKAVITTHKSEPIEFIWAGDGSLMDICRQATAAFPQIQFIGRVDNVEQLYAEASVYYQPSLLESHGISVLGAMYHRLPCVVSDQGGLKESVADGKSGYVIPVQDRNASTNCISNLLENERLRNEMGEYGHASYLKKFTKQIWEQEMKNCFSYL